MVKPEGSPLKTALITGGAGFVGAHLAIGLRQRALADRVIALDNLRRRGSELNLPRLKDAGVDFLHGDVRNPEDIAEAGPIDLLIECSAEPSVLAGYTGSPSYVTQTNLTGTIHCLDHARRHGAAIIFLSTSRVYPIASLNALNLHETDTRLELDETQPFPGITPAGIAENFPLDGHRSLYGATKLCSELLVQEYAAMYGLNTIINRCGLLTGPGQMGKSDQGVIALWAARHAYGGTLKYIGHCGTGKQVRDFLHVEDLLNLLALQLASPARHNGTVYNVGGGRQNSLSLLELTTLCQHIGGKAIEITPEPSPRDADIPLYLTDTAKVRAATGWAPKYNAEQTLSEIFRWLADNERTLRPILA